MARNEKLKRGSSPIAGGVRSRILDAAQQLFLKKGYQSASIDDISQLAPASKPTIYAHFSGKEALFAAAVSRTISGLAEFEDSTPEVGTIEEKLLSLGTAIVDNYIEESLGMLRATIAEAQRFPELGRAIHDAARDRSVDAVSQLLNEAGQRPARAPKSTSNPKRGHDAAQMFLDLIVLPMLFRLLLGERPTDLKKELPIFMRDRIGFFLAVEADWSP